MAPLESCRTERQDWGKAVSRLMMFITYLQCVFLYLSKPNKGLSLGTLHHRGEGDFVSDYYLINRLYFKSAAITVAVGSVDPSKVPDLREGLETKMHHIQNCQ